MSKRSDRLYVNDILECIEAVESYCRDLDYAAFVSNRMVFSATLRELEVIGEAAGKISATCKEQNSDIAWRMLKDFRNVLAHEYFGVDNEIIWDIVKQKLPLLKLQVRQIKCL